MREESRFMSYADCDPKTNQYAKGAQDLVDLYTLGHAAAGAICARLGWSWETTLVLALVWEVIENPLKDEYPHMFPDACHDRIENAVVDVIATLAGWYVFRDAAMPEGEELAYVV